MHKMIEKNKYDINNDNITCYEYHSEIIKNEEEEEEKKNT